MTTNWLTPQQIIDADAKVVVDTMLANLIAVGGEPSWPDPSFIRSLLVANWRQQAIATETTIRAWQDGGVFAESFDRQWCERVAKEQG